MSIVRKFIYFRKKPMFMLCLRIAEYGLIDLVPELSSSCFPGAAPSVAWAEMRPVMPPGKRPEEQLVIQLKTGTCAAFPFSLAVLSPVALLSCTLTRLSTEWQRWRRILLRYSPLQMHLLSSFVSASISGSLVVAYHG